MALRQREWTYPADNGLGLIHAQLWRDDGVPARGVIQIAHGMAEYADRYADLAAYLAAKGFWVYANDHAGHGHSDASGGKQGYFGPEDGWRHAVADMRALTEQARAQCPNLPVILLGHSMGSFLSRQYAAEHGELLSGLVLVGTGAGVPGMMSFSRALAKFEGKRHGADAPCALLNKLAFGGYVARIEDPRTVFDWLSRDSAVVDAYLHDPLCGFTFTAQGFYDLFSVLQRVNRRDWAAQVPRRLPILMISGEEDPVGGYGKGVAKVAQRLRESGHAVELILYPGGRHEILNETNRQQVYADVYRFVSGLAPETGAAE
ncbi:MAG: alpha/beta fold hydrolase [Christensenellales bacterium]|jgi:alpha-beta hydrolase superfamily lysophospholipase